jgi:predicted nucleotidyltransferase
MIQFREGDFVESVEGLIFDVKGFIHPEDRVIAYVRYVPDPLGDRVRGDLRYRKIYELNERFRFLSENYPQYLFYDPFIGEVVEAIPRLMIKSFYKPEFKLAEMIRERKKLNSIEDLALKLAFTLRDEANIPLNKIGISGSILLGLHNQFSDLDIMVYGYVNCLKVYEVLKTLRQLNILESCTKIIDKLYRFRSRETPIPFSVFRSIEEGKLLQGLFHGREYFIRLIKDYDEIDEKYGDRKYRNLGEIILKATITNDSESMFTPCKYIIDDVEIIKGPHYPVKEITSFRGRFCEQAKIGNRVVVRGKLEEVKFKEEKYYRVVLGGKGDYLIPIE